MVDKFQRKKKIAGRGFVSWVVVLLLVSIGAGCGGGGGDAEDGSTDLFVVGFSTPDFAGIFLNEQVSFTFSEEVRASSLNFDSIRLRTGPNGGVAPRGEFVRGTFTLGQVDPSETKRVTFLPAVPNKVDLSDTGYLPGSTYTVVVPSFPSPNTVKSVSGDPVVETFASQFTTLSPFASQLFLDGDFPGSPGVTGVTPQNGQDEVSIGTSITLEFSEPLLPSSVIPSDPLNANILLQNVSSSPPALIPVSYFLAQTREDIRVILNPLSPLEEGKVYQVTVRSFVTDLVGNGVTAFVSSFSTGGQPPAPTNFIEDFSTNAFEDESVTTANWNDRLSTFVGGMSGKLTAAFAPFAGDGADGALTVGPGQTVELDTGSSTQRVYRYSSVNIQLGGTLRATGSFALAIQVQGDFNCAGTIDVSGAAGQTGISGDGSGDGSPGSAETLSSAGAPTGGVGGTAGPGGFGGGDGGNATTGAGGSLEGQTGGAPSGVTGGRGGFSGDLQATDPDSTTQTALRAREPGGGGGHAEDGEDSPFAGSTGAGDGMGGFGGDEFGEEDMSDAPFVNFVRLLTKDFGGAGGGGGGAEDDSGLFTGAFTNNTGVGDGVPTNSDEGGGGGGGGGGALHVLVYGDASVSGVIVANGGRGGDTEDPTGDFGQGRAGGGGAGGTIFFQVRGELSVGSGAVLSCTGGNAGNFTASARGGVGAPGYIRLEDDDGDVDGLGSASVSPDATTGAFSPLLTLESMAVSRWFNTQRASPRYGTPTEIRATNGGTIVIEYQGAPEDIGTVGPNPDLANLTPWVSGSSIDTISNNQHIRFRVRFTVPEDHDFNLDLPEVDLINVPISF